jgi:hypothetical protein
MTRARLYEYGCNLGDVVGLWGLGTWLGRKRCSGVVVVVAAVMVAVAEIAHSNLVRWKSRDQIRIGAASILAAAAAVVVAAVDPSSYTTTRMYHIFP